MWGLSMLDTLLVGIFGIALTCAWMFRSKGKLNLPPGPLVLPIIGSVIQVALADHEVPFVALQKLAKKYGNIMRVKLGSVNAVAVSGYAAIKDMQTNPDFINRLDDRWLLQKTEGLPCGLLFSKNEYWADTRRIAHSLLKQFGFGKASALEPLIIEELKVFSEELKSKMRNGETAVEITNQFEPVFMNSIWILATGTRLEHDDPELRRILKLNHAYASSAQIGGGIFGLFPELLYYFPNWSGYTKMKDVQAKMQAYMEDLVAKYRKQGTYRTSPGNFVESFLQLIDQHGGPRDKKRGLESPYSDLNLIGILNDLALGGSDTSANTTNFGIRYLVQNPHVQAKMQREIDQVLGRDRWVTLEDRPNLKYTQAVILETLRISSVVPVFPRKTFKDCKLGTYDIPKDTLILPNIWSANMDEDVWENPDIFKPERFLDPNGNVINSEKLLSFGIGRRNCIGETVAKINLLMAFTSLVQQFSFEVDPASGVPLNLNHNKLTRNTMPFKILIKLRH